MTWRAKTAIPNRSPSGIEMPTIRSGWDRTSLGVSRYEFGPRSCSAPKVLLCFAHCWRAVVTAAAEAYCFIVASAKRSAVRCVSTSIGNSLMEMRSLCDHTLDRHRVRVLRPSAIDHLRASRDAMVSLRGVTFSHARVHSPMKTRCDLVFCGGRRASVAPHFHRNC
jgi:hypothetical protein